MSDSPTKRTRPLEVHSPNVASNAERRDGSPMKCTPLALPRMPSSEEDDENREGRGRRGEDANESLRLSPISRANRVTTPGDADGSDSPSGFLDATLGRDDDDAGCSNAMDASFPDRDIEIHSPGASDDDEEEEEEADEERVRREIEESEALARQLMAEEAMASYAMSAEYLRANADQFSGDDLAALRAAVAEEDPEADVRREDGDGDVDAYDDDEYDDSSREDLSYDALLRLGERIGDVKDERWATTAREAIDALPPPFPFVPSLAEGKEENHTEVKCQVCQFPYEDGEVLRRLPCGHCFHRDCVDAWLETKDACALCRKSIVDG
ncbi:hypothetical protein ACHAWF_009435 [Thalassiosira exigua]